jgi:uncharacterized YccA/Bax inhibitor family protein
MEPMVMIVFGVMLGGVSFLVSLNNITHPSSSVGALVGTHILSVMGIIIGATILVAGWLKYIVLFFGF